MSSDSAAGSDIGGLFTAIDAQDGAAFVAEVTNTRHDGSRISIPFANVFEYRDSLIADYRIYIDIGLLYAT